MIEVHVKAHWAEETAPAEAQQAATKRPESEALISLSKILVATDFSPASDRALDYAMSIARRYDSHILLTHIITPEAYPLMAPEVMAVTREKLRRDSERSITNILTSGRMRGVLHEVLLKEGPLAERIGELIEKHEVDLIVLGTHGKGVLKKLLLGSGAEQIFRQTKCPVLTVGPAVGDEVPKEVRFKNILFATDFGPGAEREAAYAFSLAQEHGSNLVLLHVVPHTRDYSDQGMALKRAAVTQQLRELAPMGSDAWCIPVFRMKLGDPVEKILETAKEIEADLIVMGAKRRSSLASHLPHTVAYRIVCAAKCPVLTVRT